MKYLLIVILCSFVVMVCCTTKNADIVSGVEKADQDSLTKQVITDTVYLVESNDEDFIKFIKKFHTDTIFQFKKIDDDILVHGYYWDGDSNADLYFSFNPKLDQEDFRVYLKYLNAELQFTDIPIKRTISIISDTTLVEEIISPNAHTIDKLTFVKKGREWILTEAYTGKIKDL